jgi:hypothetical protein
MYYNGKELFSGTHPSAVRRDRKNINVTFKHLSCHHTGTLYAISNEDKLYARKVSKWGGIYDCEGSMEESLRRMVLQPDVVPELEHGETIIAIEAGFNFVVMVCTLLDE